MENFTKNQWVFCEFKLQQIQDVENGVVKCVSDGQFQMSGNNLSDRCFPLEMPIKRASDTVAYWSDELHKLNHNSLNHPDINRELIRRWVDICENIGNNDYCKKAYDQLAEFCRSIIEKVCYLKYAEVEGVRLFR